jgi:hypothetical protein
MAEFVVTWTDTINADDEVAAAVEAARLLQTTRPAEFFVKRERGKNILIRVDRGEGKRL